MQGKFRLYWVQVIAVDRLHQHKESVLADRNFDYRKILAVVPLVLKCSSYGHHRHQGLCA